MNSPIALAGRQQPDDFFDVQILRAKHAASITRIRGAESRNTGIGHAAIFVYGAVGRGACEPVMNGEKSNTGQKALQINLDAQKYGTFAEIGAGQEVARWFFHVGGASGTVAKSMSAYDMAVSDAIYGPSDRYVSRQRLQAMLDYEFDLLLQRLNQTRGDQNTFFVFADTVATTVFPVMRTARAGSASDSRPGRTRSLR